MNWKTRKKEYKEFCETYSKRLKTLMNLYGDSAVTLIKNTNIKKAIVYRWLKAESVPNWDNTKKLCEYFDTTPDYLNGSTDQIFRSITNDGIEFISRYMGMSVGEVATIRRETLMYKKEEENGR